MKSRVFRAAFAVILTGALASCDKATHKVEISGPLVLTHCTVIDGKGGRSRRTRALRSRTERSRTSASLPCRPA